MSGTPEKLTLPAPAQTLWRGAQQVIHEELQQFGTPHLGGGTTLGARWGHRESSDIHLTIEPEPGGRAVPVSSAIMTPGSRLLSRLEGLGLGTVKCEILTEAQFHVTFHDPNNDNEIRFGLDIASVSATPRLGQRRALVEGSPAIVLSTTQILTGKLHRWGEATLRDAIDFDHAARRDRSSLNSLTRAVNTLSSIETEARKQKFLLAATKFTTIDDPVIRRMDPEHRPDQSTLGQATADIIHGLRYADVRITARSGICHFEATTHNQHQIHLQCRENQVDTMFATCGIDDYLHMTLKHPGTVRNEVRHACRRPWRNHPPILQQTHPARASTTTSSTTTEKTRIGAPSPIPTIAPEAGAPEPARGPSPASGYAASLERKRNDPSRTR